MAKINVSCSRCCTRNKSVLQAVKQEGDEVEQSISKRAADLEQLQNRNQRTLRLLQRFGHHRGQQPGAPEGASHHPGGQDPSAEPCVLTDAHPTEQHCQDIAPQPSSGSKHQGSTQQPSPASEALFVSEEPLPGCDAQGSNEPSEAWSYFAQVQPSL